MVQEGNGKSNGASGEKERVRSVKAKPAKVAPPVRVRTIDVKEKVMLVEWAESGKLRRAMLPVGSVELGTVAVDILAQAIPYGQAWEDEGFPAVDAEKLANELHREGIWTPEDLLQKTHLARAAIQRAYINPIINQLVEKYRR